MNNTQANLVFINGKVWTGAQNTNVEAVAICNNRIAATGNWAEVKPFITEDTKVIDLKGKLLVPGFIDNHTHFFQGGFKLLNVNLSEVQSEKEMAKVIGLKAQSLPKGKWITGGNWDHEFWPGAKLPTKQSIDAYTPEHPVFVTRMDLHMGLANSTALNLAGITANTPDPDGGVIVRDAQGQPTGILKDKAMNLVQAVIPTPTDAEYDEALQTAMDHAVACGITSIQDITSWEEWAVFKRFHAEGKLKVRVYARTPIPEWEKQCDSFEINIWLKLGGVKGFVDGSVGSCTAVFFEPYLNMPETTGVYNEQMYPEGMMANRAKNADKAGLQISIHAIGDKANHELLDIYQAVINANGARDRRLRLEHAQQLIPGDIRRIAEMEIIASMQPAQLLDDACWLEKRIGSERSKMAYLLRTMLDKGIEVTFGTDWPVVSLNPLLGIYAAVTRQSRDKRYPLGWVPEQRITVEEAVHAYTAANAYAEFNERDKGVIAKGKLADMVVLSEDIFTIPQEAIPNVKVLYTVVDGKIVYQAGS